MDPAVSPRGALAAGFVAKLDWHELGELGLRAEDKGPIQVVHWRGAPDEERAEREVRAIEARARERGLIPLWGRKVLELRPVAGVDKGTATRNLLAARAPLDAALFAGDDRTDLDAFRALTALAAGPQLGRAVRVGVASSEGPAEIRAEADMVVSGTEGVVEVLRELAED